MRKPSSAYVLMRMRKVAWACEYLQEARCHVDPIQFKNHWPTKLAIEIGCGKGRFTAGMAEKYPDTHFVAIEKNESAAGLAAKHLDDSSLSNVSLIYGDASQIDQWFKPHSISTIYLNFSDPWPKKRNTKRRLSSDLFLKQYQQLLTDSGTVVMKSDNANLMAYSLLAFQEAGFKLESADLDYDSLQHPQDVQTEYEEKFVEQGKAIYRFVWKGAKS